MIKAALALGLLATIALVAVAVLPGDGASQASAGNGGMEAMSIDADPTGNTATTLGERNDCVEAEAGSDVVVDVTALNIPASNPMIGFAFNLNYDPDNVSVTAVDNEMLLTSAADSNLFDATEPVPDSDGVFNVGPVDTGPQTSAESGSGVLSRITLSVDPGAPAGAQLLTLNDLGHVDTQNVGHAPQSVFNAQIAVGVDCESLPPPPTPTPPPAFVNGDIDCDGDVDAVDALQVLRHVAGLGANQMQPCPPVGG